MPQYYYENLFDKNIIPDDCINFIGDECKLDKLPKLPDGLEVLSCRYNNLTELPELPVGLEVLYCDNNNIIELPELPVRLRRLYCYDNKITKLPVLPNGLKFLSCCDNNITELPELPNSLTELYCYNNPIKYITLDIYSIMKRIYLHNVLYLCIDNTIFYDNTDCSSLDEFFGCE